MERAKFYSRTDLSNGIHLIRAERVLDNYQEGQDYENVNDVLELFNVKLLIDNGLELNRWTERQVADYKTKVSKLGKDIVTFFRKGQTIDGVLVSVESVFAQDFWIVIEKFGLIDLVSEQALSEIFTKNPDVIENILHCEKIVREYESLISSLLCQYKNAANLLLHAYLISDEYSHTLPLYIPNDLTADQKCDIIERYLNSGEAKIGDVRIIMQAKDVPGFSIPPKLKLQAKKLELELAKIPQDAIVSTVQTGFSIEYSKEKGIPPKKAWLEGTVFRFIYSEEYLDSLDKDALLSVFVSLFEYFDNHGMLNLCYNWHEGIFLEKIPTEEIEGFYPTNKYFQMKNNIAVHQVILFDDYMRRRGSCIETSIKDFYEKYFRKRFGFPSMPLNLASDTESFINKNKVIAPEMESVVKQYNMFVDEGGIEPELFQMSMPLPIAMCKSLLWGKHRYVVWGDNVSKVTGAMNLLFSDQSLLSFVTPFKDSHYNTLYNLLIHEKNVKYDNYEDHQRPKIDFLIENGYLVNHDGNILLADNPRIEILYNLYYRRELSYYYHEPPVRKEIDRMVGDGILKYDDYLLSPSERHYVNFFLNSSEFSNGMQLRNKYSHGAMSCLVSDNEHRMAYYYFLMIFIIILLKMNEDMELSAYLNEAVKCQKGGKV